LSAFLHCVFAVYKVVVAYETTSENSEADEFSADFERGNAMQKCTKKSGAVFTTLPFLRNLQIGPIR